ncbi:MAG: response regulator [Proteobacteria bacterium]|nr:response regulator [Pseudomonadota bacterium]
MSPAEIMVVEDESIILRGIENDLKSLGYQVVATANTGEEAIEKANTHHPDLVLMDIKLKGPMDGIQAAEYIRNYLDIPSVFISTYVDKDKVDRAKLAKPFGYLLKPVNLRDLQVTVEMSLFAAEVDAKRKTVEESLRASEKRYQDLYDNAPDMYVSVDAKNAMIIECNRTLAEATGYAKEEIVGRSIFDMYAPESAVYAETEMYPTFLKTGNISGEELQIRCKDGSTIDVSLNVSAVRDPQGKILYSRSSWRDITEKKRLEKEHRELERWLFHTQKMESLGTLAGGIAHDFNNLLFQILGYTQLAIKNLPEDAELLAFLEPVQEASNTAADLVRQILTFSRSTINELRAVTIQPIVKEALKLLRSSLPTTIEIRLNIDTQCESVLADPIQIYQVVMNLCTNAYQAMRKTGGILEVSLYETVVNSENQALYPELTIGGYVELVINDTGHGMDDNTLAKIFDPYFTTKSRGEGTGLGLGIVQGIVNGHKGAISVFSTPGKGTTFKIYLPRAEVGQVSTESPVPRELPRGKERILVVDDKQAIIEMIREMLTGLGYRVTSFSSSADALEAFRAVPREYDLVITDQTMPEMTGAELSEQLLEIRPDTPIILMTGYSEIITEDQAVRIGVRKYLLKPLEIEQLARSVRDAL